MIFEIDYLDKSKIFNTNSFNYIHCFAYKYKFYPRNLDIVKS